MGSLAPHSRAVPEGAPALAGGAEQPIAAAAEAAGVRAGLDRDTARELAAHWPELLRHAQRLMPNPSDAKDLVQDTFERAIRGLPSFARGSNMRAWLYTIMVRRSVDHYRRERIRGSERVELEALAGPEPPEEHPWSRITEEQFQAAVLRLKPCFREVFELHDVHQVPYQEIAERLDIPLGTVGTRLRRAREKLRDMLSRELQARDDVQRKGGRP
jgi:RNA polymerase sigma-70 factor (ECF subfamily)